MNSPLVEYTKIAKNYGDLRDHSIDRISFHCVVGQLTVERLGEVFQGDRLASSNYGVDYDGRVGMYVEEAYRSYCTSSKSNDMRAVTIEIASDTTSPYAITDKAMQGAIDLAVDICKRNGKDTLLWFADKDEALSYEPQANEMVITCHRWFSAKSCPGDYIFGKLAYIASEVNRILQGIEKEYDYIITATKRVDILPQVEVDTIKLARLGYEVSYERVDGEQIEEVVQENPYTEPTRLLTLESPIMNGEDVKWLQWELSKSDCYNMDIDGYYGNGTDAAVRLFQKTYNLTVDGMVGSNTRTKLKEV